MVTENNDYVGEGPSNDQMKYLCSGGGSVNIAGLPHTPLPSATAAARTCKNLSQPPLLFGQEDK